MFNFTTPKNIFGFTEAPVLKQVKFRICVIKSRIAETLIQQLFLAMDYNVQRYTPEQAVSGSPQPSLHNYNSIDIEGKAKPDFFVQHRYTQASHLVKVKYRADGRFSIHELGMDYVYDDAFIIVVSRRQIKCLTVRELKNGKEIAPECRNHLGVRKEFDLNKELIVQFLSFAQKLFKEV